MKLRPAALAGPALASLALIGCGWTDSPPPVAVGPRQPPRTAPTAPTAPPSTASTASTTRADSTTRAGSVRSTASADFAASADSAASSPVRPTRFAELPRFTPRVVPIPAPTPTVPAVPTRGAQLDELPPIAAVPPVAIRIPDHGVANPVVAVGIDAGTGELSVPADPGVVGWYEFGATPGAEGSAVLAGHLDWKGRPGAFIDLDQVQAGDRVEVDLSDGTTRGFVVVETHLIAKTALPPELFERSGPPRLVLITCGGDYDSSIHRYRQNVVVVASPA